MSNDLRPRAVLFDLYRTLLDIWTDEHRPEVWAKLAHFLRYQGLPADAGTLHNTFFGMLQSSQKESSDEHPEVDVLGIFRTMLLQLGYNGSDHFFVEVTQLFRKLSIVHFDLFPDTLPTLQALHGSFKLGLVSDAQRVFLEPEIEMTGLTPLLDIIIISSDYGFHKPDPRLFAMALEGLGVSAEQAVYIGDSIPRDICGAQKANLPAILLNRDGHLDDNECSCKPDKIFSTLDELRAWLLS